MEPRAFHFKFQGMIKWGNPDHPKFKTGNFQSIPTPKRLWSLPEYVPIPIRLEKIKVSKNAHDNRKNKSLWNKPLQLPWITKQSTVGKWNKQTFLVMDKLSN